MVQSGVRIALPLRHRPPFQAFGSCGVISPHTAPGTKVVCVDDADGRYRVPGILYGSGLHGLKSGETYTVARIETSKFVAGGFIAVLVEIDRASLTNPGYSLGRFRYAALPSCLTEILNRAPAPKQPVSA